MLLAWEYLIEPYIFGGGETNADRWELVALGMISGGLALATPLFIAIRD